MDTKYQLNKIRKRTIFSLLAATFVLIGLFVADVYTRFSATSRLQITLNKTLGTETIIDVLTDKRNDFVSSIQLLAHSPSEKNESRVVAAADAMVTSSDTIVIASSYDTLLKRMANKLARQTQYFRQQVRQRVEYSSPGALNKDTLLQVFVTGDAQEVLRICINDCYYALKELRKREIALELEKLGAAFTRWVFIVSILAIGLLLLARITIKALRDKVLARNEAEATRNLLTGFIDHSGSPIYVKDLDGRYLLANSKFAEGFSTPLDGLTGKRTEDITSDPDLLAMSRQTDQAVIRSGKAMDLDAYTIPRSTGEPRTYISTKFPLFDAAGKVHAIGGVAIDITERVNREAELSEAKLQAETARAAQQVFLANMSHEMRTPLNGIVGLVNLLQLTPLSDEQADFLASLQIVSNSLLVLINDILDISKIQAGKLNIESIVFPPGELFSNINRSFRYEAERKGLQFILQASPAVPEYLVGDPTRLNQILINLIGNAIKFTSKGFIKLNVNVEYTTSETVKVIFVVQDTGIGISPEHQKMIFDNFSQASQDTARKFGGSGLGLTICKELINIQQGEIAVSSKLNEGTTFWFYIPYQVGEEQQILPGDLTPDGEPDPGSLPALRCLIVEDNLINQKVVFHTLEKAGIISDIAGNGLEAIKKIKADGNYDFVIMDIQMPEMDGYETTRVIRSELNLKDLPIIAMTASALKGEKERCQAVGMNDYVPKPFTMDELFTKIRRYTSPAWKERLIWPGSPRNADGAITGAISNADGTITATDGAINTADGAITKAAAKEQLFDLSHLRQMGDDRFFLDILNMFLHTVPDNLSEIQRLIGQADWDSVAQRAHKLKSSVGIMQMHSILQHISTIEQHAKERNKTEILPEIIEKCLELFNQVRPAIEKIRNDLISPG